MNKLARPLELIEAEINFYKAQTANGIIEIGKRLIEAKEQVAHGEWSNWLREKVEFTERTAQNFMKVAREIPNTKALSDLPITKIYALLDVPSEQREEFTQQHNLKEMTTREVEKAVKEFKEKLRQAQEEIEFKEMQLRTTENRLNDEKERLEIQLKQTEDLAKKQAELASKKASDARQMELMVEELKKHIKELEQQGGSEDKIAEYEQQISDYQKQIGRLNTELAEIKQQLKEKPIEVSAVETVTVEKVPEEVQRELEELRRKATKLVNDASQRYKVYFDIIVDNYKKLLSTLAELRQTDLDAYVKYRKATAGMLAKLGEQVKDTAEPAGHCGECVHADMDGVTDEQLDDCKTLCTKKNQIVDFEDAACEHYKSIRG